MTDALEKPERFGLAAPSVDNAEAREFAAQVDIVGNGKFIHQVQFLVNHDDAEAEGIEHSVQPHGRSTHMKISRRGLFDPAQDLHQRTFARPVFAHQSVDFSGAQFEIDIRKCLHIAESFGEAFDGYYGASQILDPDSMGAKGEI
jgi:hypothetical protein